MSAASWTFRSTSAFGTLASLQRERHVLADGHVRIQRVALEHHRDVAVARGDLVDDLAADPQLAGRDVLEARDHVQRVDLPQPDGPTRIMNSPSAIVEVELLDGLEAVRIALDHVVENDVGHVA